MKALAQESDERWLIEAAQHDPSRFAELYENNFERVYAYVARRVGNRDQAEDVTAEVFQQALANLSRFEWRGVPFAAWLLRIASNALADHWKRTGRTQDLTDEADVEDGGADEDIERRAMLFKLVETLPPDQRLVIVRRFVEQRRHPRDRKRAQPERRRDQATSVPGIGSFKEPS